MTKVTFLATLKRFCKHTAFSLFGTATDTLVLWILSDFILNGYAGEYLLAPLISFECSTIVNFIVSSRLVWPDRMKGKSLKSYFKHFLGYNASYSGAFLFKMVLLLGIQAATKWDVVVCNILALMFSGILNFVMNEKVIFRKKN